MLNYCEEGDLSAYKHSSTNELAVAITTVSCCLSILGALGIFWTYYVIPEIRNFVRTLMLCLTVADFLTASGYILSIYRHYAYLEDGLSCRLCIIQSFITTLSSLVSFFLTMIIAVHISVTIWVRKPITGTRSFMIFFNGISWLLPGAIVTAAFFKNYLGMNMSPSLSSGTGTGPWCWIAVNRSMITNGTDPLDKETIFWMTLTGKGWEMLCYLVTTSLYVLLKLHLYLRYRYHRFNDIEESLRYEDKNYVFVFLVLFAIRVWGTIRFFLTITNERSLNSQVSEVLENMQAFGDPSQAFFNFVLFCLLDRTVQRKIFPCSKNPNIDQDPLVNAKDASRPHPNYGNMDSNWHDPVTSVFRIPPHINPRVFGHNSKESSSGCFHEPNPGSKKPSITASNTSLN